MTVLPIRLGNTSSEVLLEVPVQQTDKAAIFLPGVSGGAFSERYQSLVNECTNAGIAIARLSSYKDSQELHQKTIKQLHQDIDNTLNLLQSQGYNSIFGIGKSFGGALMLTNQSPFIRKKVLWAPAIGVSEAERNFEKYQTIALDTVSMLTDITLDRDFLKQIDIPILIIHGTADDQIPFSNSEKMIAMLQQGTLLPIEGADHSYKNIEHETAVIKATVEFLSKDRLYRL